MKALIPKLGNSTVALIFLTEGVYTIERVKGGMKEEERVWVQNTYK